MAEKFPIDYHNYEGPDVNDGYGDPQIPGRGLSGRGLDQEQLHNFLEGYGDQQPLPEGDV